MAPLPFLFAAFVVASPAGSGATSHERAMLDTFKAACLRTGDIAAMKADALATGWEEVAEDSDPRLARLTRMGREGVDEGARMSGGSFRRTVDGRALFLVQSRVDSAEGYWGAGCRLYDFEATAPLDPALLEAWMGGKPTGVEDLGEGLGRLSWEPGWGPVTVNVNHVPTGHPVGATFGTQGNILVAQAIGGF